MHRELELTTSALVLWVYQKPFQEATGNWVHVGKNLVFWVEMEEMAAKGGNKKARNPTTSKSISTKKQPALGTVIAGLNLERLLILPAKHIWDYKKSWMFSLTLFDGNEIASCLYTTLCTEIFPVGSLIEKSKRKMIKMAKRAMLKKVSQHMLPIRKTWGTL